MINVSQTIKNSCKADKNTHAEYILINNQRIYIKGKLNATAYKDTTFFGTFNMKVLEFETENTTQFRNRKFEYYKVIDGNAFKIGTFITTEVVDNDSKETIKVTANDYGLKFAVPYTTSLDYTSGNITLFQVLQECCTQVGITLRNQSITNGDFIVDSNQFVNNELVGDVVSAIAGISGNFATIDENDNLYLLFANNTGNLITKDIEETDEITNFNELNDSTLKGKTTQDGTPTPSNPIEVETITGLQYINVANAINIFDMEEYANNNSSYFTYSRTTGLTAIAKDNRAMANVGYSISITPNTKYYVKTDTDKRLLIAQYNLNGGWITNNEVFNDGSFTTNANASYLRIKVADTLTTFPTLIGNVYISTSNDYQSNIYETNLGKNLFDIDYMIEKNYKTTGSEITNYYIKNADGSLTIDRDNDSYGRTFLNKLTLQAGTYTLSFNVVVEGEDTHFRRSIRDMVALSDIVSSSTVNSSTYPYYTLTFTLTEQKTIGISINPDGSGNTVILSNIQLEKGNQATSYSPYFEPIELCKIGDYQDKIYITNGKNLFSSEMELGSILGTGELQDNNNAIRTKDYIAIEPNTTYTMKNNKNYAMNLYYWNANKEFISSSSTTGTFTTPLNAYYLKTRTNAGSTQNDLTTLYMLNKGTTAIKYEPYGTGKWYLHKETKKIVLDGTQSSSSINTSSTNTTRVQYNHYADGAAAIYDGYSNLLTFQRNWGKDTEGFSFDSSNGGFWIRINKTTIGTTASEVNTYLASNNLISYIPLTKAAPVITEITNTELINQLENIRLLDGYNYIVSSLPIEIEYYDNNGEVLKDYTDLNDKRDTQPITSVSIGSSQIQGQEAILRDTELIEEYGEHWLTINDNPFAYTLEKRQQLVTTIFNKVKGFGYSSFTSKYTYRPYLSLGDKIKFKNKAGQLINSIILRYNMDYDDCTFEAPSITSSTINYELSPSPEETAKRAEIIANQAEAKITSVVSKVDEVEVTVYGDYELTKDTTYQEDKTYYIYDGTDYIEFTDYEVGDTIPVNTIYERDETSSLEQRMQQTEQTLTEQGLTLEIKTSKIDDDGNTTSFKTTNYTLDENGFEIDDGSGYKSLSTTTGQYYYDNDTMVGKYTKDIAVHKDLALYGKYYYGIDESVDVKNFSKDDAMFMAQMYEAQWQDENNTTQTETGLGHFWNGD